MLTFVVLLLFLVVGLLAYVLASTTKVATVGLVVFAVSLAALLFGAAPPFLRLR